MRIKIFFFLLFAAFFSSTFAQSNSKKMEEATLGGGCFWCLEAVYSKMKGIQSVESGYAGGLVKNPTYKQVCTGTTGHAEVIKLKFDPKIVTFQEILEVFWTIHDPTTLNRQGNDIGTQYRSVIFYHSDEQKKLAETGKKALKEAGIWANDIVTEIVPLKNYYPAENYHQDYYANNPQNSYCTFVVKPKVEKFKKIFKDKLKK